MLFVANEYFIVDGEKECPQKSDVKSYYWDGNKIFGTRLMDGQKIYFVIDTGTGEHQEVNDVDLLPDEKKVFNSVKMIELNAPNEFQRYIRKFIPLKFRKR